jgi:capsular exopolysaccharide synthesis family protein
MAGLGAAIFQDWIDQRIRSALEAGSVLDLEVLGAIPKMTGRRTSAMTGQEMHLQPRSEASEAYRRVRTAVTSRIAMHMQFRSSDSKLLLITSPASADGKTTVASNLAIGMAQAGRRVLLIDADMRRPSVNRVFNVDHEVGLSGVLTGKTTLENAIRRTSTEHLEILCCGPLPTNPAELLDSPAMGNLLRALSAKYDQIIIDSPPVVLVTDACILATMCDATVLVIRAEKSTTRMSRHARDALANVGANLLGTVINCAPRGGEGYGYYSGYGYYRYGYGPNGSGHSNGVTKEITAITVSSDSEV